VSAHRCNTKYWRDFIALLWLGQPVAMRNSEAEATNRCTVLKRC
jgi:hypothetical protein